MQSANDWFTYRDPDPAWIASVAAIPGFRWRFNNAKHVAAVDFHRSHLPLMPEHIQVQHELAAYEAAPALVAANELVKGRDVSLRPYQAFDLPFLLNGRARLLAYEMRLGKTVTAALTHDSRAGALVVVGPLISRDVWRTWIERVHSNLPLVIAGKQPTPVDWNKLGYYFIHYDILDYHTALFNAMDIGTLIIDEIHLLQARRSKRISALSLLAARASRIIGLSGTPMWTQPRSMWPILNLLAPGAFGSEFEFCQRYTNATQSGHGWKYEGTAHADELRARLNMMMVRRTWSEVLGQLPPVTNVVEPVVLTHAERTKFESAAQLAILERAAVSASLGALGSTSTLRRMFGLAKVARAVELAQESMRDGHKVVLWHWHNEVGNALHAEPIGDTYRITANDSQFTRDLRINNFQKHDGPAAFIVPLAVGGTAIDLSSADVNIFVELDYVPATMYQASMRIFKPDAHTSNVYLYVDVDIERRLVEVLGCNEACQSAIGLGYAEIASRVFDERNVLE